MKVNATHIDGEAEGWKDFECFVVSLSIHIGPGLCFSRLLDVQNKGFKPQLCQVLYYFQPKPILMDTFSE